MQAKVSSANSIFTVSHPNPAHPFKFERKLPLVIDYGPLDRSVTVQEFIQRIEDHYKVKVEIVKYEQATQFIQGSETLYNSDLPENEKLEQR